MKSVKIQSFFWSVFSRIRTEYTFCPNTGKYGPEKTPYLDIFDTVAFLKNFAYLSVFNPNARKYGPEKTPYLDTFDAVSFFYRTPPVAAFGPQRI